MFDHILVPLDGSQLAECVLPHIESFARAIGARVTLLNVVDQFPAPYAIKAYDPVDYAVCKAEALANLNEVSARLSNAGLQAGTALMVGKAADCIIQYAHDHKASLIALSSHGRSGLSGWNISSVVQKVLLRAHTSVLIIPAYHPVQTDMEDFRYRKVFVALDGSMRAEWVIPVALKLIEFHRASLLLAHIVPRLEVPSYLPLDSEEVEMINRIIGRNKRVADKYLKWLCSQLPADLLDIRTCLVVNENPIEALQELVERESADLVILSAHGCSGGTKRPYGGVTLSFISYGTTPLLILQDLSPDRILPTRVEMAAREYPGH